jgi:hypothetical protein
MAAMSSEDGLFGPGLRGRPDEEKSRRREEQTILAIHQRLVEFEQRGRFHDCGKLRDATGADKERDQSEHKTIDGAEIRGTLPGAIADDELLLEQQRFRGHRAHAARAQQFRYGYEKVNCEEQQIAHELHTITPTNLRKTVREAPFRL